MKRQKHIHLALSLGILVSFLFLGSRQISAQYKEKEDATYGNTPKKQVPYGNYQEAYKQHFIESQAFTGAGREKGEPTGLTEVRLGVLAPLEGNVLVPQGRQLLQGGSGRGKCPGWIQRTALQDSSS